MIKTTQYKNTSIGPIPTDWELVKIKDIGQVKRGAGSQYLEYVNEEGIRFIRINDFFEDKPVYIKDFENINNFLLNERDILFAGTGATAGAVFLPKCEWFNLPHSYNAPRIRVNANQNKSYIFLSLQSNYIEQQKQKAFVGAAQPFLDTKAINDFDIPLPPLPEQQKIADVLSTWDKAIQETDTIIKKLEARNKALAFSLLTGKKRVKGFEGKWDNYKLEYFFEEYSSKPKQNTDLPVFTSSKNGLMSQSDYYSGGRISTRENVDYNIIPRNYITYRSRSDDGLFTFNKNTAGYDGLISGYYPVFKVVNGNDNFFLYYLNFFKTKLTKYSTGTSQLVLSFKALKSATFNLPSLEEQNAIAEILNTANQEVKQYQQKLEALKLQKKGLMQQLLTGKVRTV